MSHTMVGKHSDMALAVARFRVSPRVPVPLGELGTADHELPNTAPRPETPRHAVFGSEADEFEWEPSTSVRKLAANTAREPSDEHVRG